MPSLALPQFLRRSLPPLLLQLTVVLMSAACYFYRWSEPLDLLLYDSVQPFSPVAAAEDIVIIEIDERSMMALGRWPWPRHYHAQLLDVLNEAKTRAVAFDVIFADPDSQNPADDKRLAEAIHNHGQVVLPVYMGRTHRSGQVLEIPPISPLYEQAAGVGHVHVEIDSDGVCRSVFLKEGVGSPYWPHLAVALLTATRGQAPALPGTVWQPSATPAQMALQIVRNHHNLIPMVSAQHTFTHVSYIDVINGGAWQPLLRGKTVFVGATAAGAGDVFATPVGSMSGVTLNAIIYQALRDHGFIQAVPKVTGALITALLTALIVFIIGRLQPMGQLIATAVVVLLVPALCVVLLFWQQTWLAPTAIIAGAVLYYPLWSWRRLELALGYLRTELAELTLAKSSDLLPSKLQLTAAGLRYLESMDLLRAWTINQAQKQIMVSRAEPPTETEAADVQCIQLHGKSQTYAIDLYWSEDCPGQQRNDFVAQLAVAPNKTDTIPLWKTELIGNTIDALAAAKAQVHESENLVQRSLSLLQDCVIVSDLCGRITFINDIAERYFQTTGQPGVNLLNIMQSVDIKGPHGWAQVIRKLLAGGKQFAIEGHITGDRRDVLCQGVRLSLSHSKVDAIIITLTDITQLKASEKARTEALHFLSHDLRSPMVSVLALLEKAKTRPAADRQQTLLTDIENNIRKNLAYCDSFLHLARAESATGTQFVLCDIHSVLDSALAQGLPAARKKSIAVKVLRTDNDAWTLGDAELLERAVVNLLSNAVKYCNSGGDITAKLKTDNGHIVVEIIDTGCGIEQKNLGRLFDRFQRVGNTGSASGSGLGLYFVKVVADRHGGIIHAASTPGRGTTFTLTLPLHSVDDAFSD
jgi:signal transduction histidine kinase/CHASE2 domain-containing sensor protein